MRKQDNVHSVEWLAQAIRKLPPDEPVPSGTRGYNLYRTQKEHWLGWLEPEKGTGTYPRRSGNDRGAGRVYGAISEPLMLLWLAFASGVPRELIERAEAAASSVDHLRSKCGKIRAHIPWAEVAAALEKR